MPPLSTQKFPCHQSFEIAIGTAGVGFFGMRPVFCSDRDSFVYSTSNFAGTTLLSGITNSSITGVTGATVASFPYTRATMLSTNGGNGVDSLYRPRLVSIGAHISYSGKATDRAGTIYSLVAPTGEDISNRTLQNIIGNPASMKYSINDMEHAYLTVHGTLREHYNLQNPEQTGLVCLPDSTNSLVLPYYDYNGGGINGAPPCIAIMLITGTPGTTLNVDIIGHYEVGGDGPGCLLTPCLCDEPSLSHANNVSKVSQQLHKSNPNATKGSIANAAISLGMNAAGGAMSKEGKALQKKGGVYAIAGAGMQLGGKFMKSKAAKKSIGKLFHL